MKRRKNKKPRAAVLARLPWDFGEDRKPGEPVMTRAQRMPPEAAAAGKLLARMSANGARVLHAAGIALPKPCRSCAFRPGTVPNRCVDTVADALKCVFEGERHFLCHEPREGTRLLDTACWGAMRARAWAVEAKRTNQSPGKRL